MSERVIGSVFRDSPETPQSTGFCCVVLRASTVKECEEIVNRIGEYNWRQLNISGMIIGLWDAIKTVNIWNIGIVFQLKSRSSHFKIRFFFFFQFHSYWFQAHGVVRMKRNPLTTGYVPSIKILWQLNKHVLWKIQVWTPNVKAPSG